MASDATLEGAPAPLPLSLLAFFRFFLPVPVLLVPMEFKRGLFGSLPLNLHGEESSEIDLARNCKL